MDTLNRTWRYRLVNQKVTVRAIDQPLINQRLTEGTFLFLCFTGVQSVIVQVVEIMVALTAFVHVSACFGHLGKVNFSGVQGSLA